MTPYLSPNQPRRMISFKTIRACLTHATMPLHAQHVDAVRCLHSDCPRATARPMTCCVISQLSTTSSSSRHTVSEIKFSSISRMHISISAGPIPFSQSVRCMTCGFLTPNYPLDEINKNEFESCCTLVRAWYTSQPARKARALWLGL
jgi:hypothetical protein